MRRIIALIIIFNGVLYNNFVNSQNSLIHFGGYLKSLQSIIIPGNADSISTSNLIHNRLNLKMEFNSQFSFRLELRNRLFLGDQLHQIPDFEKLIDQNDDFLKLSKLWLNKSTYVLHSVIDRMQFQFSDDNWDIRLGRQRINWGIHNFWNPNDIFNTFNFLDFDFEERPGSDAIRIQYFNNGGSTLEAAFKPGRNADSHTAGLLYKINKSGFDFQFLGGIYKKDLVFGGGWAGGIHKTGWKSEFSYFIPYKNQSNSKKVFVLTSMMDQTFSGNWYVSLSGLFQSTEADSVQLFNSYSGTELSAKYLFPSQFSFLGVVSKSLSGIISTNLSVLYATHKNILIVFPTFSWSAADNLQVDLTGQSFFSKSTNTYGSLAHSVYLRMKWSF